MITYQFRLLPTNKQLKEFQRQLDVHKSLYNHCLEQKINIYKETGKSPTCFDQIKSELQQFKNNTNVSSLQQTIRRLDKSYQSFFKKNNSFPRFKNRFRTIEFTIGDGCQIKPNGIYIQHVGIVECIFHREIIGKIKSISITRKNGTLYVNIGCEQLHGFKPKRETVVGIDFGIQSTMTTSDGTKLKSETITKNHSKTLARLQRKKEKSKNKRKVKKAIAKVYTKIQNKRKDFNHKISRCIVDTYDIICIEDLKVSEITSEIKNINKRLYDIGISQLKQFLIYKAENAGKLCVLVNPAYTTQMCSSCGIIKEKSLKERIHKCACGLKIDRDINAANNTLRIGLDSLGVSP